MTRLAFVTRSKTNTQSETCSLHWIDRSPNAHDGDAACVWVYRPALILAILSATRAFDRSVSQWNMK